MGGQQSTEAGQTIVSGNTNKQLAIIAASTFLVTSFALYMVHSSGQKDNRSDAKKKKKKKRNKNYSISQQSRGGDQYMQKSYVSRNREDTDQQNYSPDNSGYQRDMRSHSIRRNNQLAQSYQQPQFDRRTSQRSQQQNLHQSHQNSHHQSNQDFRMVPGNKIIEKSNIRKYTNQGRDINNSRQSYNNSQLIRSEMQDSQRHKRDYFESVGRDKSHNNGNQRAQSVQQLAFDNLSVATSNQYLEDSDEEGDFIEYEIKLKFDEDDVLSYQTMIQIFDKRQVIKGIKKMKHEFKVRRRKLLVDQNVNGYKKIVQLYRKAIESKLEDNLKLIANKLKLNIETIEAGQEKHLLNVDFTFILGIKDFLKYQPPSWLTGQKALDIYSEIKELTQRMAETEFQYDGRKIDLYADDEDAEVLKYKALDSICLNYHIEEEQLKHVLYVNYILPNQEEATPLGNPGPFQNPMVDSEDMMEDNYRTQDRSQGNRNSVKQRRYQ